jgi:hypothetical protein
LTLLKVENDFVSLTLREENGEFRIMHKPSGQVWAGPAGRFCSITLDPTDGRHKSGFGTDRAELEVDRPDGVEICRNGIRFVYAPYHRINTGKTALRIEFTATLEGKADVVLGYSVLREDPAWRVHSVTIVDDAMPIAGEAGYAVLPAHQGEVVPVGSHFSDLPGDRSVSTRTSDVLGSYSGVGSWNMAMFALVNGPSTAVITWEDPDVEAGVRGEDTADGLGWQIRSTVILNREARQVRLHFMENAGYVDVAQYYRVVAKERGLFDTLAEKIARVPELERNIGALRFTVSPKWGRSAAAGWITFVEEGESRIDYTFDEVAEITEHFAKDLGVERGLTLVKSWSRRGYDMDYPDPLPAASECGGNEALAHASERVRNLGWQFGIHDNPLILFKESPSTDTADALVRIDGTPVDSGIGVARWQLYQCCPDRMMRHARRNYPQFKELFQLNYLYSDQLAAVPLYECFSPDHPMTRWQTIEAYRRLTEYGKSQFGVVTSEVADEWAVPIFDAMGLSTDNAHPYAYPIPLFELVYRECVNLESWPWGSMSPRDIINTISRGRMVYLTFPNSDYLQNGFDAEPANDQWSSWWNQFHSEDNPFLRGDQGWGEQYDRYDRLVKTVYEVQSHLNRLTAHQQMMDHVYLNVDRTAERVIFEDGTTIVVNRGKSDYDHEGTLLPNMGFLASAPTFVAFHARRHDGVDYPKAALFTVRSLDGKPIGESRQVRVYHGFGVPSITIAGRTFTVQREAVLDPREG